MYDGEHDVDFFKRSGRHNFGYLFPKLAKNPLSLFLEPVMRNAFRTEIMNQNAINWYMTLMSQISNIFMHELLQLSIFSSFSSVEEVNGRLETDKSTITFWSSLKANGTHLLQTIYFINFLLLEKLRSNSKKSKIL